VGKLLADQLKMTGRNQSDLAALLGRPIHVVNDLITGKREIDFDLALELAEVFPKVQREHWIQFQMQYRTQQRAKELSDVRARVELERTYPFFRELQNKGWIEKKQKDPSVLLTLLRDFMRPMDSWGNPAFKLSEAREKLVPNLRAWQAKVWHTADQLEVPAYRALNESAIQELLGFVQEPEGVRLATQWVRNRGVRLVFVSHLHKCPVDGVASENGGKPYIGMSLRYGKLDTFWFVLLHELSHILHKHEGVQPDWLEDPLSKMQNDEKEANGDADGWLIPPDAFEAFVLRGDYSAEGIQAFARRIGRHESIVVGRLKHQGVIPYSKFARIHGDVRDMFTDELV